MITRARITHASAMVALIWAAAACAQVQSLSCSTSRSIWPGASIQEGPSGGKLSIARFTLQPGVSDPPSHMKTAEEWFLIEKGHGTTWLAGTSRAVEPGDVVRIAPPVIRRIAAMPHEALIFEAITTPAFDPADYVSDPHR